MKSFICKTAVLVLTAVALVSGCNCHGVDPDDITYGKVMILYSAGYNSLSKYLQEDIQDLKSGYIPAKDADEVLLVVSHHCASGGDYQTANPPTLVRFYNDRKAGLVLDTLSFYSSDYHLCDAATMKTILQQIQKQFKSDHYGMVVSSHSTGWLPKGYYNDSSAYDQKSTSSPKGVMRIPAFPNLPDGAVPYVEPEEMPGAPAVKSIGETRRKSDSIYISYEMDITDFAAAIPMHLDYLIFDACLTGGIEVAYELKDKTDIVSFSQTEVLAEGLDYTKIAAHLLESRVDVKSVAADYYDYYASQTDISDQSATVSVIDCTKLDELASVCNTLFSQYRDEIAAVKPSTVQRYFRTGHHWFYDLEDILTKSGISVSEQQQLKSAINSCVLYKAATEAFLEAWGGFKIEHFSGFSMYLPCNGSPYLDSFYKTLAWNKATGLVN